MPEPEESAFSAAVLFYAAVASSLPIGRPRRREGKVYGHSANQSAAAFVWVKRAILRPQIAKPARSSES